MSVSLLSVKFGGAEHIGKNGRVTLEMIKCRFDDAEGLHNLFVALNLLKDDLTRFVDQKDDARCLGSVDEHRRRRVVVHPLGVERLQSTQIDGEVALAARRHIGYFKALELDVVAHFLDDASVLARLELGVVGRRPAVNDHFTRAEDLRFCLVFQDLHGEEGAR